MQVGSFDDAALRQPEETGQPQSVLTGIWRLPLPVPFPPGWANAYLLGGPGTWCLVDCGMGTRAGDAALASALESIGVTARDLTTLVLTHPHPDHIGPSGDLAAAMGARARVIVSEHAPRRMFGVWGARRPEDLARLAQMQRAGGLADDEIERGIGELLALAARVRLPDPFVVQTVADGDAIELGGRTWRVLWAPGHEEGSITLISGDVLIVGDHILPAISPNVSLYPDIRRDPLADYLAALEAVAQLDLEAPLALPGHGWPFTRLEQRIAELREGHRQRSAAALHALRAIDEPATAIAVARAIFGGRLRSSVDQRLALGETLAHLTYLVGHGAVAVSEDADGELRYRPAEE
jgi:glyoxylase-like metal-dependent hydrolase (beta-lactamase superfamily II)